MADVETAASYGGLGTAIVAITVAIADRLLKARDKRLEKQMEKVAPTAPYTPPPADTIFERAAVGPSPEMIARVEQYVRAEGELRIELARKEWEIQHLVIERDKALAVAAATRRELDDLRRDLQSGHAQISRDHPGGQPADISGSTSRHRWRGSGLDRPEDRVSPRKPKNHQDG